MPEYTTDDIFLDSANENSVQENSNDENSDEE